MHSQIHNRTGLFDRIEAMLDAARTRTRFAAERSRRVERVVRELEAYSDQALADLGLMRCDIHRIARETVDGPGTAY